MKVIGCCKRVEVQAVHWRIDWCCNQALALDVQTDKIDKKRQHL